MAFVASLGLLNLACSMISTRAKYNNCVILSLASLSHHLLTKTGWKLESYLVHSSPNFVSFLFQNILDFSTDNFICNSPALSFALCWYHSLTKASLVFTFSNHVSFYGLLHVTRTTYWNPVAGQVHPYPHPPLYSNGSGMNWGTQQQGQGVDLSSKCLTFQSNWASVGFAGQTNGILESHLQVRGLKGHAVQVFVPHTTANHQRTHGFGSQSGTYTIAGRHLYRHDD